MSSTPSHLRALKEIEQTCIPGLVEVLRTEGIEGVRYALWDLDRLAPRLRPVPLEEPRPGMAGGRGDRGPARRIHSAGDGASPVLL